MRVPLNSRIQNRMAITISAGRAIANRAWEGVDVDWMVYIWIGFVDGNSF